MTLTNNTLEDQVIVIKITALVAQNGGEEVTVCIELSDGLHSQNENHTLLTTQYVDLGLKKGEIDREVYEEIIRAANISRAYKKGVSLLSYSSCSQKNLYHKLRSRGFDDDTCAEVIEMLVNKKYVNEDDTCTREIERCIKKLWGKNRIISHLHSKGFESSTIKNAFDELCEIDFVVNCKALILKNYSRQLENAENDKAAIKKIVSSLERMGYTFSEIKSALQDIL